MRFVDRFRKDVISDPGHKPVFLVVNSKSRALEATARERRISRQLVFYKSIIYTVWTQLLFRSIGAEVIRRLCRNETHVFELVASVSYCNTFQTTRSTSIVAKGGLCTDSIARALNLN